MRLSRGTFAVGNLKRWKDSLFRAEQNEPTHGAWSLFLATLEPDYWLTNLKQNKHKKWRGFLLRQCLGSDVARKRLQELGVMSFFFSYCDAIFSSYFHYRIFLSPSYFGRFLFFWIFSLWNYDQFHRNCVQFLCCPKKESYDRQYTGSRGIR